MKSTYGVTRLPRGLKKKELIVFDLDGTLAPSKGKIDGEIGRLLAKLLAVKDVAVIGGGSWAQFKEQLLDGFECPHELLRNLFLFPVTSTAFYRYHGGWKKAYAREFSKSEKKKIRSAFKDALREIGYVRPKKIYGEVIEDRGAQMTFSALGQDVVKTLGEKRGLALKQKWHDESDIRSALIRALRKRLPEFEHSGGFTSVDVTKRGIDKAYGVREIKKTLKLPIRKMLFVGDALDPGGNDYAAKRTGIDCVKVKGPEETKRIIGELVLSS